LDGKKRARANFWGRRKGKEIGGSLDERDVPPKVFISLNFV